MRVVFFGNHTVGVRTLEAIAELDEVAAVIAHPSDPEDGIRYLSVYEHARNSGLPVVRGRPRDPEVVRLLADIDADLIWVTDYRYVLPREMFCRARWGAVNLHPSLLPKYRGRAPINWAILNGETRLGLTAHFIDDGVDSGDIIAQRGFQLRDDQDVGDALDLLYPLYKDITREVLEYFRAGQVPRMPQDHTRATSFPRRTPEDGSIDWTRPATDIINLVRAVARPYPGAFTTYQGDKLRIWKAARLDTAVGDSNALGMVLSSEEDCIVVQCCEGAVRLCEVEWVGAHEVKVIPKGAILGR